MIEKPGMLRPALTGGIVLGLLSSIPVVSLGNICCCLWVLLGGALAAFMLIRRSPLLPVTAGEGAKVGAMAGIFGSLVLLIITVPINILNKEAGVENMRQAAERTGNAPAFQQVIEFMQNQPVLFALLVWLISAAIFIGFATLGGVIAVAIFEKRKGQPTPPPPGAAGYSPDIAPPAEWPNPPEQPPSSGNEPRL